MRARALLTVGFLLLLGCEQAEPRTPYDSRGLYELPPERDAEVRAQTDPNPEPVWPRRFTSGDTTFATYEPLVDSWKDGKLEAHAAVEVFPANATRPKVGFVWFDAPTRTDRERGLVTIGDTRVLRVRFPTATDQEAKWLEGLRGADLAEARIVAVDRLQRQVAYAASQRSAPSLPTNVQPPVILVSETPQVLALVTGPPQMRDEGGVRRVTNTRALILSDRGSFYVWVGDRWFRASSIDGTYAEARDVPPALDGVRDRVAKAQEAELFTDSADRVRRGATVVVATKPTELIETRGAPVYEPIPGTKVAYVSNTESDVLQDSASGQSYALLSPGWFRALTLRGPWVHVPGPDVPSSFREIPRDHREARVLPSIPNTPEAEEADIAATIPQTATVERGRAQLAVAYDGGAPDFRPVDGTTAPLRYAVNASTPVITTGDGLYYAVEDGVWFVASSPDGPWTVASSVPEAIYSIPQSSPIHYVTYVRVYGYSPDYVYVGYLPGYVGATYTGAGIVFGGGYGYGSYGYPYPYYPYRPRVGVGWYGGYGAYGGYAGPHVWRPNVYQRWSPSVVHAPPARLSAPPAYRSPAAPSVGRMTAPPAYAPRVTTPPAYAPRPSAPGYTPRVAAPPAYAPRVSAPPSYAPRVSAPPSYAPRVSAPPSYAPRVSAPPSYAPRVSAPPAVRGAPPAVRSAPPAGRR